MRIDPAHAQLLSGRKLAILAAIKRDGRPHLSNVSYHFDGDSEVARVSVTDDRAKVKNLRRDPRASLHVSSADGWRWVVGEGVADLSPVALEPDDPTVEELVSLYRAVAGEHPDWDDFRRAMVADRRLVLRLPIEHTYASF